MDWERKCRERGLCGRAFPDAKELGTRTRKLRRGPFPPVVFPRGKAAESWRCARLLRARAPYQSKAAVCKSCKEKLRAE